jgi:membrane protein YdbS with pleckstrin-like domain
MEREARCVLLILLIAGTFSLVAVGLVIALAIVAEVYYPTNDGPILWDQLAIRLLPLVILGLFLIWLSSRYRRHRL